MNTFSMLLLLAISLLGFILGMFLNYCFSNRKRRLIMPYVERENRIKYMEIIEVISDLECIETKGDLEYLVFKLMKKYMSTREYRYTTLHDCIYAVQHVSHEFCRRFLDKREDIALIENGDILENEV